MDFEFPISSDYAASMGKPELEGLPYKSNGGEMVYNEELDLDIPKGWESKTIKDVCEVINGRAYKETEFVKEGTPIIRIQNLSGGTNYVFSDPLLDENKYVENDDLIFAWSATFGPFIWRGPKSIYHYHIWKLNCFRKEYKHFLYNYLTRVTGRVSKQRSGSIFAHITKSLMESQKLLVPNDHSLTLFDSYVSKIDRNIATILHETEICSKLRDVLLLKMSKAESF